MMRALNSKRPRSTLADAHEFRRNGRGGGMTAIDYLADADRERIAEEVREMLLASVRQQFPRTGNLEYAILKTHLIIENALAQYIRCTSAVLVELESLRFSFSQKLEIAVLHGFGNGCPTSVPSIEILNRIRNQVAHKFSIDRKLVHELVNINIDDGDASGMTDRQLIAVLRRWCFFICGMVVGEAQAGIMFTSRALAVRK
jgi:hypothetical protein